MSQKKRSTAAEVVAEHINAVTKSFSKRKLTPRQLNAALILARCFEAEHSSDHPSPFPELRDNGNGDSVARDGGGLWTSGDLAGGTGGEEFIYAYLPVRFVDHLAELVEGLPEDIAVIYTTAATMYFVGTLRAAIDEAVTNVFYESGSVIAELIESRSQHVDAAKANTLIEDDSPELDKERFNKMLDRIITEGNQRRRDRLKEAMVDARPGYQLRNMSARYRAFQGPWKSAVRIFAANQGRTTWKQTDWKMAIQGEVLAEHGIELPIDFVSLLSDSPDDRMLIPGDDDELNASGLALIHAARECGLSDFSKNTGALRMIVSNQEKAAGKIEGTPTIQ